MGDVIHMHKKPEGNEGEPYVRNGMLFVPQWYPQGDARCIEPGCTAMTPEQDPIGFSTCGNRHHRTSDGLPRVLSRIVDLKPLPEAPAPREARPIQPSGRRNRRRA